MLKRKIVSILMMSFTMMLSGGTGKTPGKVCFTFDDARYKEWLPALPLFKKYNAHATFFFNGKITPQVIDAMKKLQAEGHSIGLHTVGHVNAVPAISKKGGKEYVQAQIQPQLDACQAGGVKILYFAYPNNVRTEESDRILAQICGFRRFRAGVPGHKKSGLSIAQDKKGFLPQDQLKKTLTLSGFGIGKHYNTTQNELDEALEEAAKTGTVLTLYSHGISEHPQRIDMSLSTLEVCLKKAKELGLDIVSFDELN